MNQINEHRGDFDSQSHSKANMTSLLEKAKQRAKTAPNAGALVNSKMVCNKISLNF